MTTLSAKPVRRAVDTRAPHGYTSRMIVTLYPGGILGIREARRRREITFDVAKLYVGALLREVQARRKRR